MILADLTKCNLKEEYLPCCRCRKMVRQNERADCINLEGKEVTYCFECYEKALKKYAAEQTGKTSH